MPVPLSFEELARWEAALETASRTQSAVDEAVLVGGTAVNVLVPYRTSQDTDHLVHNLASIWNSVLERLDGMDGWNFHYPMGKAHHFWKRGRSAYFPNGGRHHRAARRTIGMAQRYRNGVAHALAHVG